MKVDCQETRLALSAYRQMLALNAALEEAEARLAIRVSNVPQGMMELFLRHARDMDRDFETRAERS